MKLLFVINTEGQVHTWKNIIKLLAQKGHMITIVARDYGYTLNLLLAEGLKFESYRPFRYKVLKPLDILKLALDGLKIRLTNKPDIVIGFGVDASICAKIAGAASIVFTDNEPVGIQNILVKYFSDCVITPEAHLYDFKEKHIRMPSYKELAYLHPDLYRPDLSIKNELGIKSHEKYVILRFNGFNAVHDIGRSGFSPADKYQLVQSLGRLARVFISSEAPLPQIFEKYRLPVAPCKIHDVLFSANLLVADTGTMPVEASLLGVPTVVCLSNYEKFGYFTELSKQYGLMFCYSKPSDAIQKALEIIKQPGLKVEWKKKAGLLLSKKVNSTSFLVDFLEKWPASFHLNKISSRKSGLPN